MITLDVKAYCDNCPNFEADVSVLEAHPLIGPVTADTFIRCAHAEICEYVKQNALAEYLKEVNPNELR